MAAELCPARIVTVAGTDNLDGFDEVRFTIRAVNVLPDSLTEAFTEVPSTPWVGNTSVRLVFSLSATVNVAVAAVHPGRLALMTVVCGPSTLLSSTIVTRNCALVCPADTVTVAGTVAAPGSVDP